MELRTFVVIFAVFSSKIESSKVLVGVGLDSSYFNNKFEIFDLNSPEVECEKIQNFPNFINAVVFGLDFDERPMICGGYDANANFRQDCHIFDGNSWVRSNSLTEGRVLAASTSMSPFFGENHKIFVSGGFNGQVRDSLEVLSPDGWISLPQSLPVGIYSHCMALINDTAAIVVGGYSNGTACSKDTYILNTETGAWTEGPPLNVGRVDHSCTRIRSVEFGGEVVIVVGGNCGPWLSSVEYFDPIAFEWRAASELPTGIGAGSLVQDDDGGIVLIGGCSEDTEYLDTFYRLPTLESKWSLMEVHLNRGLHGHVAIPVSDNRFHCGE